MADTLNDDEIDAGIAGTGWSRESGAIVLDRRFDDFAAAMSHVNAVADAAEAANHHPDILVHGYNNVRLTLTTHSAGGVTQADLEMARTLEAL